VNRRQRLNRHRLERFVDRQAMQVIGHYWQAAHRVGLDQHPVHDGHHSRRLEVASLVLSQSQEVQLAARLKRRLLCYWQAIQSLRLPADRVL
jgi:hypothetical protein